MAEHDTSQQLCMCPEQRSTQIWSQQCPPQIWSQQLPTQIWADQRSPTQIWSDQRPTQIWSDQRSTQIWSDQRPTQIWSQQCPTQIWSRQCPTQNWSPKRPTHICAGHYSVHHPSIQQPPGSSYCQHHDRPNFSNQRHLESRRGDNEPVLTFGTNQERIQFAQVQQMNICRPKKTPLIEEEARTNRKKLICQNYRMKRPIFETLPSVKAKQPSTIDEIPTENGEDKLEERTKATHCSTPIDGTEHCEEALKKMKCTTELAAGTSALICAASPVLSISVPLAPSTDDASASGVPLQRGFGKRKIFIENWELLTPVERRKKLRRINNNISKYEKRRAHLDVLDELVGEIVRDIIEAEVRHAATMEELGDEKQNIMETKLEKSSLPAHDGLKTNIKEEITIKSEILDNPEVYNMDNMEIPDCLVMSESKNILEAHPFVKTEQPSTNEEIPAGNNEDKALDLLPIIKTDIYNIEDDESTEFFIKTENCDCPNILTKENVEIIPDKPIPNLHKLKETAESTQCSTSIEGIRRCEELLINMKELQNSSEDVVSCMFCRTKMLKKCSLAHLLESHNSALDVATILLPTSFQK